MVTINDLSAYTPVIREPVQVELDGWSIATNPPPAVGGSVLAAMLLLLDDSEHSKWDTAALRNLAMVQRAVLDYRRRRLDPPDSDRSAEASALLEAASLKDLGSILSSPSTAHTSAVDSRGNGCAVTVSAGYGSGMMAPGTGFWLNNCLGEMELHPEGFHGVPTGTRLVSNMAPTVARSQSGGVLSIGSPGADRITTAIASVLLNFIHLGMSLTEAVRHPRLHTEVFDGAPRSLMNPVWQWSHSTTCKPGVFPISRCISGECRLRCGTQTRVTTKPQIRGARAGLLAAAADHRKRAVPRVLLREMIDVRDFVKLLLDPTRLAVLGRAAEGKVDAHVVASSLGVSIRRVNHSVARLRAAGLLTAELELNRDALRSLAETLPRAAPADPEISGVGVWSEDELDVLGWFFSGRRLVSIPASRSKRLVVLDRLSQEFERGVGYEEAEVNFMLQLWFPDYASLRRLLVDERFMTRADGVYWRTGGPMRGAGLSGGLKVSTRIRDTMHRCGCRAHIVT